jgi:MYXO-CTERM domain-containing protein
MRKTTCTLCLLTLVCATLACGADGPAAARVVPAPAPAAQPVSVADAMRAARYTFRRDGDTWVSGDATFVAGASATGLTFTPYHHARAPAPRGRPLGTTRGATARIATTHLGRGLAPPVAAAAPTPQADGAVTLQRGGAVERYRVTREGAEQSWAFAERPVGVGDLTVRVRVTGLAYRGVTRGGLHFADPATGLGVRYSHATWVDGSGARTAVPAVYEGDSVLLRVPERVLESSRFPAVLDPTVSPEFGVDRPAAGPAPDAQSAPAVAWDGAVYLAVWEDLRGGNADIYAARVSLRGEALDPAGIVIATGPAAQRAPDVTFDGSDFVVAWQDHRGGDADVYAARVSSAGVVLDRGGVAVATGAGHQGAPAVATDGAQVLVAWEHEEDGRPLLRAARWTPGGRVLDDPPVTLPSGGGSQRSPVAVWNGSRYLIAWEDFRGPESDIYAARMGPDGSLLDAAGIAVSTASGAQFGPSLACHGAECFATWADLRDGASFDVYGARLGADGALRDAAGLPVVIAPEAQVAPAVAWDGARYVVAWQDARVDGLTNDLYATRVDPESGAVGAPFVVSPANGDQVTPALVAGAGQVLALWDDRRGGRDEGDVTAARIDPAGLVLDPAGRVVSAASAPERAPAASYDGGNYLVVWESRRMLGGRASWDVLGMRVGPTGEVLDPAGIVVAADADADERAPAVAWNGAHYLVSWEARAPLAMAAVRARRVGADGSLVDAAIDVAPGRGDQRAPTVAAGPGGWLVAWQDGRSIFAWDVYGAFISGAGVREGASFAVSDAPNNQTEPRAASDGSRYLVTWSAATGGCGVDAGCNPDVDPFCEFVCDADPSRVDVHASWVTPALGASPRFAITSATGPQTRPVVAGGGGAFLVAWEDRRGTNADVRATTLAPDATAPGAEVTVSSATGDQRAPSVAFGGGLFELAWQDERVGGGDIYVARVLPSGAVLDPTGLPVATESSPESSPAIALSAGGTGLVAYSRFDASPPYGSDRVRARMVAFGAEVGASCSAAIECGTGLCAGGLCCPSACDDRDPCTDDGCDGPVGTCTHVRLTTPACTPDASAPDASAPDASAPDASAPDASAPDASAPDASAPDASAPDVSAPDASAPDATVPDAAGDDADAPEADGGSTIPDAATSEDVAPTPDAAVAPDAAPTPDAVIPPDAPLPKEDAGSAPTDVAPPDAAVTEDAATPAEDARATPPVDAGPSTDAPSGDTDVPGDTADEAPKPGCGCSVPGSTSSPAASRSALFAALMLAGARRRRR